MLQQTKEVRADLMRETEGVREDSVGNEGGTVGVVWKI